MWLPVQVGCVSIITTTTIVAGSVSHRSPADDGSTLGSISNDQRELQPQPCHICPLSGPSQLRNDTLVPPSWSLSEFTRSARPVPDFLAGLLSSPAEDTDSGAMCAELESYAVDNLPSSSPRCLDVQDYLRRLCCTDLPPPHECQTMIEGAVLGREYRKYIAPAGPDDDGAAAPPEVGVRLDVSSGVDIANHGVDGGAVSVAAGLHLDWRDPRLDFSDLAAAPGCTSLRVRASSVDATGASSDIWVPSLAMVEADDSGGGDDRAKKAAAAGALLDADAMATVLADGRVYLSRYGRAVAQCETLGGGGAIKECAVEWRDEGRGGTGVQYIDRGVVIRDPLALPEYRINESASAILVQRDPSDVLLGNTAAQTVTARIRFDPLDMDCNICGHSNGTGLIPQVIPSEQAWLDRFGFTEGFTCRQLDALLTNLTVASKNCEFGRAMLEEPCCDDVASAFDCESSVHDILVERTNTITPPDPSSRENDTYIHSKDAINIDVWLDILHILEVHIKSNTMEMLVALDLEWYDDRLAWEPFVGGCHRATFRASIDAELTEIWVPNMGLINMVEGMQSLPEAHASVRYDGRVLWRRSGVLRASCEMSGIKNFPFDRTGCYLEFGEATDPLFHRVKYVPHPVEYGRRVNNDNWNFQEYKLDTTGTSVTIGTEELSGFKNEIMRFQFYFLRASNYYIYMFVSLYIIFTFLSFGMFFIEYHIGERLGYGSSILFVIVAQDITMSDFTPVTQEFLWIYQLSLGSKIFVICGIVQSIAALYYYYHDDLGMDSELDASEGIGEEESRRLIEEDGGSQHPTLDPNAEDGEEETDSSVEDNVPLDPSAEDREEETDSSIDDNVGSGFLDQKGGRDVSKLRKNICCWNRELKRVIQGEKFRPEAGDSRKMRKIKSLRVLDRIAALVFFLAYSIFLIILFALAA